MAGPFYFAWVDADETVFSSAHVREDEEVISINIEHTEGDFPTLSIKIINPRVGLLAPGRKRWAWLSYNRAWVPPDAEPPSEVSESESESEPVSASESESESEFLGDDIRPLFFGRLVAVPEDIHLEEITLEFIARPLDFQAQKTAVAAAKKVRPYWDPIWFSPDTLEDPDNVLESRPELWHIDRVTHVVSTSHILNGEDGTLAIGEDEAFYDSVRVSFGNVPVRSVSVTADVSWNQNASGTFNISKHFFKGNGVSLMTYTGEGFLNSWPKAGSSIGGGWSVVQAGIRRVDGHLSPEWGFKDAQGYFTFSAGGVGPTAFGRAVGGTGPFYQDIQVPEWAGEMTVFLTNFPAHILRVYRWQMAPTMVVGYSVSRARNERLTFTLEADVQATITEPGDEETLILGFSSSELASPIDSGGALPIGDVRRRAYFSQERGAESIEYLIAVARARLCASARAVTVDFAIPFDAGVDAEISLRKSAVLTDARLPGGLAGGKIIYYSLSLDGESGVGVCEIQLGCSVGKGGTVSAVPGNPTYCEEDYTGSDYQVFDSAFIMPIAGEVTYSSQYGVAPNDDGLDFLSLSDSNIVTGGTVSGLYQDQEAAMGVEAKDPNEVFERLNAVATDIRVELRDLTGGPFTTVYEVEVSTLKIPKTIDLEASA